MNTYPEALCPEDGSSYYEALKPDVQKLFFNTIAVPFLFPGDESYDAIAETFTLTLLYEYPRLLTVKNGSLGTDKEWADYFNKMFVNLKNTNLITEKPETGYKIQAAIQHVRNTLKELIDTYNLNTTVSQQISNNPQKHVVIGDLKDLGRLGFKGLKQIRTTREQALLARVSQALAPGNTQAWAQVSLHEEIEALRTCATPVEGTIFPPGEAPARDGSLVSPPSITQHSTGTPAEAWERLIYMEGFKPNTVFKADFGDNKYPYYVFFFQSRREEDTTYIAIAECPYGDNRTYIYTSYQKDEWKDVFINTTKEDAHILGSQRLNHTDTYKARLEKTLGEYGIHQ